MKIVSDMYVKIHTEYIEKYKVLIQNLADANKKQEEALKAIEDFLVDNTKPTRLSGEKDDN